MSGHLHKYCAAHLLSFSLASLVVQTSSGPNKLAKNLPREGVGPRMYSPWSQNRMGIFVVYNDKCPPVMPLPSKLSGSETSLVRLLFRR